LPTDAGVRTAGRLTTSSNPELSSRSRQRHAQRLRKGAGDTGDLSGMRELNGLKLGLRSRHTVANAKQARSLNAKTRPNLVGGALRDRLTTERAPLIKAKKLGSTRPDGTLRVPERPAADRCRRNRFPRNIGRAGARSRSELGTLTFYFFGAIVIVTRSERRDRGAPF
jgi:hypothetical protein